MKNINILKTNRKILVAALVILVLAISLGAFVFSKPSQQSSTQPGPSESSSESGKISYDPPTEQEKQAASDRKDEIVQEQSKPPVTGKRTVPPIIVDAGQYDQTIEVRAFVPGTVENDGQCTFSFTKDGATVTKQTPGIPDASTTRCTNLQVPRSEFPSTGSWVLEVSYDSSKTQGSATSNVEVK